MDRHHHFHLAVARSCAVIMLAALLSAGVMLSRGQWLLAGALLLLAAGFLTQFGQGYRRVRFVWVLLLSIMYSSLTAVIWGAAGRGELILLPIMAAAMLSPGLPERLRWEASGVLVLLMLALPWLVDQPLLGEPMVNWLPWLHLSLSVAGLLLLLFSTADQLKQDEQRIDELRQQVEQLTLTDRLTGLFNRHHLEGQLRSELSRAKRSGEPLVVALINIDGLGQINEEHGHETGDAVLRCASSTLARTLRNYDLIGRWEGQRFLLVMPMTSLLAACTVCERLRELIEHAAQVQGGFIPSFTASFGLAEADVTQPIETVIGQTGAAIERARQAGGNCLVRHANGTLEILDYSSAH